MDEGLAPADDERARYDYRAGEVERPAVLAALEARLDCPVRFDDLTRQLYATDASAYEVTPVGVVFPQSTADVAATVAYCADEGIPVLPRGGGTSLAGQSVNEAVVLDFSRHMDAVEGVDVGARTVTAQPGVTLGTLNAQLAEHDLTFGPDPAWGDKSVLGGAIGNNSTGAHSLVYEKTDGYVESCEVVLADGTVTEFGEVSLDQLRERAGEATLEARIYAAVARLVDEEADAIREAFPDLKRNVSGYDLDRLVREAEDGSVNLARLLAGSEGTLAIVTEATVRVEPTPDAKALALLAYPDLQAAMHDVAPILEHDPAAVEVLDDVLLDLAGETEAFGTLVEELLPDAASAVLLVEFFADNDAQGKSRVADLLADRLGDDVGTVGMPREGAGEITSTPVRAVGAREAHDDAERERFWKLRKSGLPILLGRTDSQKHVSFIEDTAVPPERLPEFVADFQAILEEEDTYASFYAHAGPGCLHVRPLIDTADVDGVERMATIADRVTDLVVEYGGSVSGEHGDGRARTQWNRKLYGDHVWELFGELKTAFDPDWLLNPGQVCGDVALTENLRWDLDDEFDPGFEPTLEWHNDAGFEGMVELCHGCGGCRGDQATTGGVMCPTFRASEEESTSTRGRANALRQAMTGDLPADPTDDAFATEILDLCIGCKGCKRDCPSEVDMAKLKAEVQHARHEEGDPSWRDRVFVNVDRVARYGSAFAPVVNRLANLPGADALAERTLGIAAERSPPTFARESFREWADDRDAAVDPRIGDTVLLFPDTYGTYAEPEVLRAAVRVLEAAGVHVTVPEDLAPSGRAAHSQGFLDTARERARTNVDALAPRLAEAGVALVAAEPSDAVMFQSDYLDLLAGDDVATVADNSYGLAEYLAVEGLLADVDWSAPDEVLTYHGHCHQTAVGRETHAETALRAAGYEVDVLDSGCCGMAGSFGYEAEHYSMSQAIGEILYDQVARSDGEVVVAPGASCRTQLGDGPNAARVVHPVEKLAEATATGPRQA